MGGELIWVSPLFFLRHDSGSQKLGGSNWVACFRSRTENLSEEAVGENAAGACLSAQGRVGFQAAPPLKGQGVQEGTEGTCRRWWCQLSVWAAESSETQAGVQASQALPGAELRRGPRCLSVFAVQSRKNKQAAEDMVSLAHLVALFKHWHLSKVTVSLRSPCSLHLAEAYPIHMSHIPF